MSDEDITFEDDNDAAGDCNDSPSYSVSDTAITGDEDVMSDSAIKAKEAERARIQLEIEEFLGKGGQITRVDTNVMTDPPKRPASNYGGQPI